jgi:hypothetical protein
LPRHRLIDPVRLQFGVDGLGQACLGEANDLGAAHLEESFQIGCQVMLNHRVVGEILEDLVPAVGRDIRRDQHEVQLALAATQCIPPDHENPGAQYEWEHAFNLLTVGIAFHGRSVSFPRRHEHRFRAGNCLPRPVSTVKRGAA